MYSIFTQYSLFQWPFSIFIFNVSFVIREYLIYGINFAVRHVYDEYITIPLTFDLTTHGLVYTDICFI